MLGQQQQHDTRRATPTVAEQQVSLPLPLEAPPTLLILPHTPLIMIQCTQTFVACLTLCAPVVVVVVAAAFSLLLLSFCANFSIPNYN